MAINWPSKNLSMSECVWSMRQVLHTECGGETLNKIMTHQTTHRQHNNTSKIYFANSWMEQEIRDIVHGITAIFFWLEIQLVGRYTCKLYTYLIPTYLSERIHTLSHNIMQTMIHHVRCTRQADDILLCFLFNSGLNLFKSMKH